MNPNPFTPISQTGRLIFFGSQAAQDFTREIDESLQGVLHHNMVLDPVDSNVGFVSASIDGRPWTGTMWTRDAGVFLRELVQWGYLDEACLLAKALMHLVRPNLEGYATFPVYFKIGQPGSGSELDGTGAIIIGLVLLWQRLNSKNLTRKTIEDFLTNPQSPIKYIFNRLKNHPLIPGSGEFGGGSNIVDEFYNSVQNNLVRLALLMAERMFRAMGDLSSASECVKYSRLILENMNRYLRNADGTWIWAIEPGSLTQDPEVINHPVNQGFGGMNGILSMSADVFGFLPEDFDSQVVEASRSTFGKFFAFPKRKAMFEKYGIWTQFDRYLNGYFTGPSYGQGYAAQSMLLLDRLDLAGKAVDFLAEVTHHPLPKNYLDRDSEYFFYERLYLPELLENPATINEDGNFFDGEKFDQGCGALNLVCVAEPLKIARMIAGVDDHDPEQIRIIPRLPAGWNGYQAENWPTWTDSGLAHVNIRCERTTGGFEMEVEQKDGPTIKELQVRLPSEKGWNWKPIHPIWVG
jgi:hypothetical protein